MLICLKGLVISVSSVLQLLVYDLCGCVQADGDASLFGVNTAKHPTAICLISHRLSTQIRVHVDLRRDVLSMRGTLESNDVSTL